MTSASELFYNRRYRFSRSSPADLGGFNSISDPPNRGDSFHHRRNHLRHASEHNHNHRRPDLEGCDLLQRSSDVRHSSHRASQLEHLLVRFDEGVRQNNAVNNLNAESPSTITNRNNAPSSGRLPGTVILARERLLQRLRGVSISENRQPSRDSLRMQAVPDAETLFGWLAAGTPPSTDSTLQTSPETFSHKPNKPAGLTQKALSSLHFETFTSTEKASQDCSICLEVIIEGDKLTRLSCEHRFHSVCLDPWVRTCGDCPYCRRGIVLTSDDEVAL